MSGERPDVPDLLRTARAALLDELLVLLPREAHYTARMIANALDIAAREVERGSDPADALTEELCAGLYGDPPAPAAGAGPSAAERRASSERRLARDLRDGTLDGGPQRAIRTLLRQRIAERLRVSNPRYLERAAGERRARRDPPGADDGERR